ncbi:hypothetical protein BDW02DRAFT_457218, partial [Decorospora gaudefroyi]
PAVPSFASIQPGGAVSIVLKEDQASGHRVSGIVADILTRGDHPRGVKVRLRDGRVGRVQGLVEGEAGRMVGGRVERDIRDEDEYLYGGGEGRVMDTSGLFGALEEADRRYVESRGSGATQVGVVTCPVCGEFEGDEGAVARHVEDHFGE